MKVNRSAMDQLLARSDGGGAALLYMLLLSNHGHHPGKVFAISADAMIAAGLIKMDRMQLYRAREAPPGGGEQRSRILQSQRATVAEGLVFHTHRQGTVSAWPWGAPLGRPEIRGYFAVSKSHFPFVWWPHED